MNESIKNRNEFLFLYDIKNGNPNGDPDENRPRIDSVTKHCYVTDVRLKRFIRDYLIQVEGEDSILVTKLGTKTVNLTDRVKERLKEYIFSWDEISENDMGKLIDFLKQKYNIDWGDKAKIEKIDCDKTIKLFTEKKSLSLKLNDEKNKVHLEIDDGRIDDFVVDKENGKLCIYKEKIEKSKIEGEALMKTLLETFVDLRLFGSPLAFKGHPEEWGETGKVTGPIQINFGETLNQVEEVTFHGTSIFRSRGEAEQSEQKQGTFTTYYAIPYGLIAFHGVANENAAKTTGLTENDLKKFKIAAWKGIRETSSAHTRTKRDQQSRLFLNIVYKERIEIEENGKKNMVPTEYHIGALEEKITLKPTEQIKEEINIRKIGDYTLDFSKLITAIAKVKNKIERIEYCLSPEFAELYGNNLISALKIDHKINVENINVDNL